MIKLFHSGMVGAPNTLNNVAGSLITVLDACLVNGWGSATVDSIVIASGIATVTLAGHPFEADTVSLIAGATVSGGSINGEQKVLTATATTYTFDATGISNQTATGTITHILAPLGFTKVYSGTNLAVYRANDVTGLRHYLRVDDTGTTVARVVAYISMTDVNTGIEPYPTGTQVSGGTFWYKSDSATVRPWMIVGDSKGFYFRPQPYTTVTHAIGTCYFGDFTSTKVTDNYASWLFSPSTTLSASATIGFNDISYIQPASTNTGWIARAWHGLGSSTLSIRSFNNIIYNHHTTARYSGDNATGSLTFPNFSNSSIYVAPMHIGESGGIYRGDLPGFYATCHNLGVTGYVNMARIVGVTGLTGRTLMAVNTGTGNFFLDLTGPWR